MSKPNSVILAAAVLAALSCQATLAQGPASAAPSADDSLEEIVVTAQRRAESLERTPVAVSVLGGESLARQAIVTESDLQTAVPGLAVKAGQSDNQINFSLRGQTVDAFSSSRPSVLPYVNEVQVGGNGATAFYDLESIQVLKGPQGTLFGRNSTGGAVLFTTAKPKEEFGGYGSARFGNYQNVEIEGALNLPLSEDRLLMRIAAFYQKRDGYQYNLFTDSRLGDVDRKNVRLSLTFKPTDAITNALVVDHADSGGNNLTSVAYNILPIGTGNPFVPNNFLYSPLVDTAFGPGAWDAFLALHPGADPRGIVPFVDTQRERGPFVVDVDAPNFHTAKNLVISNVTTIDLGEDTQLKNIIGYTRIKANDASEFDGTPFPADDNGTEGRGGTLKQLSEELQLLGKAWDGKLNYVTGLYLSDEKDQTRSLSVLFDLSPAAPATRQINDGKRTNKTYAVYAQGTYALPVDGLSFTAGGRYSSEKVTFLHNPGDFFVTNPNPAYVNPLSDTFKKFSWTLGLQWQVNDGTLLYANTRRSFRSGGFNFFAPPLPGFGNDGGSEYDAETATDFEVGAKFKGEVGGVPVRLNAAAYKMWVDDVQRSNYVSIFGSLAGITVNVPKAEITGVEFDVVIKPTDWLSIGGNANVTDAKFTSNLVSVLGNPAVAFGPYPDAPKFSGALFAEVAVPVAGHLTASFRADVYDQSKSYFSSTANTLNPGTDIPGYAVANFRLGLEDEVAGWSVSASVKNAFNRVYYVGGIGFSSLFAINTVIPGAPRTYMGEVRYKF